MKEAVHGYAGLVPLLAGLRVAVGKLRAVIGFDGTVDVICRPVESRHGAGKDYTPFPGMAALGERVVAADGKSAIVEIVAQQRKIGGNGPIMAEALAVSGLKVDYVGSLGAPDLDPAYHGFAGRVGTHSLAAPAVTHALEFPNGKLMLAEMSSYQAMDAGTLRERVGAARMAELLAAARLVGLVNWSCLPGFGSMLDWLLDEVLPTVPADPVRRFFFDLADPSMRSGDDLRAILRTISRFATHGAVVLGMNLNETQRVAEVLGIAVPSEDPDSLVAALVAIRGRLGLALAVGHATAFAACAGADGSHRVDGPFTPEPTITTGAGDHFNAGFCLGLAGGLAVGDALTLGVLYSGFYVRHARSPRLEDIADFIPMLSTLP